MKKKNQQKQPNKKCNETLKKKKKTRTPDLLCALCNVAGDVLLSYLLAIGGRARGPLL